MWITYNQYFSPAFLATRDKCYCPYASRGILTEHLYHGCIQVFSHLVMLRLRAMIVVTPFKLGILWRWEDPLAVKPHISTLSAANKPIKVNNKVDPQCYRYLIDFMFTIFGVVKSSVWIFITTWGRLDINLHRRVYQGCVISTVKVFTWSILRHLSKDKHSQRVHKVCSPCTKHSTVIIKISNSNETKIWIA